MPNNNNAIISLRFPSVLYEFTQGQGSDVGTFFQDGTLTGVSFGNGEVFITSASGSSPSNSIGYSIPDPASSTSGGTMRVSGSITSSGGILIELGITKGAQSQFVDISTAGSYDFDFVFNNSDDSAFEIFLRDETGSNAGATTVSMQVNSLTIIK